HPRATGAVGGREVLMVEDEPLVAMMMADAPAKLAFAVVGPFARLSDATAAAGAGGLDAAVLDVNIGGELVFPLARILADSDTPLVFITGYGRERIDQRFAGVPLLQKPVQLEALAEVILSQLRRPGAAAPSRFWEEKSQRQQINP